MRSFVLPIDMRSLLEHLEEYGDRKAIVEVRPYKKPRSLGLNAYHWAVVIEPLAAFIGDSPEEIHRELCGAYWGWVDKPFGGRKPRRTTTTNENGERSVLTWEEMDNFIQFCKVKAAEIGCPLQDNEVAA